MYVFKRSNVEKNRDTQALSKRLIMNLENEEKKKKTVSIEREKETKTVSIDTSLESQPDAATNKKSTKQGRRERLHHECQTLLQNHRCDSADAIRLRLH